MKSRDTARPCPARGVGQGIPVSLRFALTFNNWYKMEDDRNDIRFSLRKFCLITKWFRILTSGKPSLRVLISFAVASE